MPVKINQSSVYIEKSRMNLTHEEARENLKFYTHSSYEDLCWDFSNTNPDINYKTFKPVTFYVFENFPVIQKQLKDWLIFLLNQRKNPNSLDGKLGTFRYMVRHNIVTEDNLFNIKNNQIFSFYNELFGENSRFTTRRAQDIWNNLKQFYHDMNHPEILAILEKYYTGKLKHSEVSSNKYIDRFVLEQLDNVFIKEEIPLVFRIIYWLLRLYINRIGEVLSLPYNCLKQIDNQTLHLIIPIIKERAPNTSVIWREIALLDRGITGYLIKLIKQQQKFIKEKGIKEDKLLTGPDYRLTDKGFRAWGSRIDVYSDRVINDFFERTINFYNIRDQEGNLVHITSHCFRHTSITDRINSNIFTLLDIASMSGHLTTSVIEKNYIHQDLETVKDTLNELEENRDNIHSNVLDGSLDFIRKRAFSKELSGIGFCSDVRGCNNNPYECLLCDYFSPDDNIIERLRSEEKDWTKKLLIAVQTQNKEFEKQCQNNLDCIREFLSKQR